MRKFFLYTIIFLFIFLPVAYIGFWYFAMWKTKSFLTNIVANAADKEFKIEYNITGFPSTLTFYVLNPKFSNEKYIITIDKLMVKSRLLDKFIYVYIPDDRFTFKINDSDNGTTMTCNTHNKNYLVLKLNKFPFLSKLKKDHVSGLSKTNLSMVRYEDYGSKCDILSKDEQKSIMTEIDDNKNNYVQFDFADENLKLGMDLYLHKCKDIVNPERCINMNAKFDFEFIKDILSNNISFNIDRFLLQSHTFSLAASGRILNYDLITGSFKEKINIEVSNSKKLILSFLNDEENIKIFQELMLSLSEKTVDDNIQFSIRQDANGTNFIGKLSFSDFIKKLKNTNEDNH